MNKEISKISSLLQEAQNGGFYEDLVNQITKDFSLVNIPIKVQVDGTPNALIDSVREKIHVLLLEQYDGFLNLMYSMDLSEGKLNEILNDEDALDKLSVLIFQREKQKVLFRRNYSTGR